MIRNDKECPPRDKTQNDKNEMWSLQKALQEFLLTLSYYNEQEIAS